MSTISPESRLMPTAGRWQLYVAVYTFLLGVPLLFLPNAAIPFLGFPATEEPWVRIVGMFFVGLTLISRMVTSDSLSFASSPTVAHGSASFEKK
jgi:hypothetical protein